MRRRRPPVPFDYDRFKILFKIARVAIPLFFLCYIEVLFSANYILMVHPMLDKINPIIIVLIFAINLIFMATFLYAAFSDPGSLENVLNKYPFDPEMINSLPRCEKCGLPKPPRCHHCSTCRRCHLRMDHHCPVLGECVAVGNHQKFMVMLMWGMILCLTGVFTALLLPNTHNQDMVLRYVLIASDSVLFAVTLFFYLLQLRQIGENRTTLERVFNEKNIYDIGFRNNIKQIMGDSIKWFFIPRKEPFSNGFEWVSQGLVPDDPEVTFMKVL